MTATTLTATAVHDGWTLTHTGGDAPDEVAGASVPAEVPGSTHVDLLRAGLIPDPYLDRNEKALEWMWRCTWRYATTLRAPAAAEGERVDLVFDGLDTVATVALGGTELGRTFNMHRSYRFDVREALTGEDELTVDFGSALDYAYGREAVLGDRPRPQPSLELVAEAARQGLAEGDPDEILAGTRNYPHPFNAIRKMACSFGWDWGPDLQTAGIWKAVRLERWRIARLASVRPLVDVDGSTGVATVHVEVERDTDAPLTVRASVAGAEATAEVPSGETHATLRLEVPDAALWWPAGYGEAALHDLAVDLLAGDEHLDSFARRIGFRSIDVDRGADGRGFALVINGTRVLVKGANWIPDDHLMTRITRDRLRTRLGQALDANMNLLRIWGGGIYETEDFYELCDELGIMVWQDFLMACAAYAEDDETAAEIEAEARENVTRLSPHPSLVVWNGSNENVWGWWAWGWQPAMQAAGITDWGQMYYEEVFPRVLAELDPSRPYTPSSPYSTHPYEDDVHPNDPTVGTVHEWEVWNRKDYSHYRDTAPPFMSEFGFQGPATWATLTRSIPEDQRRQDSEGWLLHQKAHDGNGKLNRGFAPHLPDGADFEEWHWVTSLNQARAIQYGVEHYRSWWPHTAGTIVWQLNDCWPVTSWAAVDGDERLKPLWYALKHAYADRLLTFQPRGADGGLDPDGTLRLIAVNDTDADWSETLTFTRMALDGTELAVATAHLSVAARGQAVLEVPGHVLEAADAAAEILVADAGYPGDDDHVRALHAFAEDKDVTYERSPLTASAVRTGDGYEVSVTASALVRDLTVLADKVHPDAEADDALVTLLAGESHVFRIACAAEVDPEAFLGERVLVSVNSLVG
ncbi:glycoside hydrolase family 2 protein [Demequina sp. NBRC 110056]|uniref:glycoside hydrolase family 2 protein n=1 Tax=Demequina sp. NBRC 110056 TaxID=1570345 RepID=UPI000A00EFF4|nr:glycoside hydrolase family 2 protein [Demequina sp. NBRC 110056]